MEVLFSEFTFFTLGMLTGACVFWCINRFFGAKDMSEQKYEEFKEKNFQIQKEKDEVVDELKLHTEKNTKLMSELAFINEKLKESEIQFSIVETERNMISKGLEEQDAKLTKLNEVLQDKFENLANSILEEKSQRMSALNEESLTNLLSPLQDKIKSFEDQIRSSQIEDSKQRAGLLQEFKQMTKLNQQMSSDAQNLTKALTGESKTQGNWGEMVLESILEKSGLLKGREYNSQKNYIANNGRRLQPDVIINLPENRHIIIDSKVSLTAYEQYCSSEDPILAEQFLKAHIVSLKNHIKELSAKNYPQLYQLQSLDFVLLFVPIESAFGLGLQHESDLFNSAFGQNIILVSPTTLLATLRTIANIWRTEKQSKNAIEIAKQSGALYDKFVNFVKDLEGVGKYIDMTGRSYEKAMNKLYLGDGNLIRRAEKIRELGAKNTKRLGK